MFEGQSAATGRRSTVVGSCVVGSHVGGGPAWGKIATPPTVIVPVFGAFPEALACIRSVLKHTEHPYRLLIWDDGSPGGPLADFLPDDIAAQPHVRIERNQRNQGFVRTCNLAIRRSPPADVVLLNSDTQVTPGWLKKLRRAAYSSPRIATATPLTNNGEICSVPEFRKDNRLPDGYELDQFAALVESVSSRHDQDPGHYQELPTCVGFCVYIKREALDRVGLLDEESFGRGYGEENDFSCRARAAGYVDVLDDATFVLHRGKMSFGSDAPDAMKQNMDTLCRKHPGYASRVRRFVAENPLQETHDRIGCEMLRRWDRAARCSVLHVLHHRPATTASDRPPGGTEYHVADLIQSVPNAAHWSLFPADGAYHLTAHVPGAPRRYVFSAQRFDPSALIDRDLFDVVHVHHVDGFPYRRLADALARHGRYFVSLHDFRLYCPRTHLLTPGGRLCNGNECRATCRRSASESRSLRATTATMLQGAAGVFHFSQSTKNHFRKILGDGGALQRNGFGKPDDRWKLIEHGVPPLPAGSVMAAEPATLEKPVEKPSPETPLKVALLGVLSVHKGAALVRQLVKRRTLPGGQPVEWHLIGLNREGNPSIGASTLFRRPPKRKPGRQQLSH